MSNAANTFKLEARAAESRDVMAIARLAGELGYPSTAEQVKDRLAYLEGDPRHATFVAAVTGSAARGRANCWSNAANDGPVNEDSLSLVCGLISSVNVRTISTCGSDTPSQNLKKYFGKSCRSPGYDSQKVTTGTAPIGISILRRYNVLNGQIDESG